MPVNAQRPAVPVPSADGRIHSAVFHKRDSRVNDLIRQKRKSEIINLFNIDCCMLYRVEAAHMQFDALQNHRPYIQFDGQAEGVFLPAKMGLLFPNACDQLDFRTDYPVPSVLTYSLSDLEIATLAGNGLFNNNWSCQGRIIGSLLEIPCKVDYYAITGTPITFIEIQDRLSLHTSTMKTGYKSLVSAFLPYAAQKHNEEMRPQLREYARFDRDGSQIRQRGTYDTKAVGFAADPASRTSAGGADFVAAAQARISQRLKDQMSKGDVLGVGAKKGVDDNVSRTVDAIRAKTEEARRSAERDAEEMGTRTQASVLDARLNDMTQRMVYAGAQEIPVEVAPLDVKPLVAPKQPGQNDTVMTAPLTKTDAVQPAATDTNKKPDKALETDPAKKAMIESVDSRVHDAVLAANDTAASIVSAAKTRKERLAARRAVRDAARAQQASAIDSAAKDEAGKGLDSREPDIKRPSGTDAARKPEVKAVQAQAPASKKEDGKGVEFDQVDLDQLIREAGL